MTIDEEKALIWSDDSARSARYSVMDGQTELFESYLTEEEEELANQILANQQKERKEK